MRNLDWFAASSLVLRGGSARRLDWRRWLVWDNFGKVFDEIVPISEIPSGNADVRRVALSASASGGTAPDLSLFTFAGVDFLARDWTDEPWPDGPPAPFVEPPAGGPGGGGGFTVGTSEIPSFSNGGGVLQGGPTKKKDDLPPHAPPTGQPPTVTLSFSSDYNPANPACVLPASQGANTVVYMTVAVAGGPSPLWSLHVGLGGSATTYARSAYPGFTEAFPFTVAINGGSPGDLVGASLTPDVIAYPPTGTQHINDPLFTFPPQCVVFNVRWQGTRHFKHYGLGLPDIDTGETPALFLGRWTANYDITAKYAVIGHGAGAAAVTAFFVQHVSSRTCNWTVTPFDGGDPSTGTNNASAPGTIAATLAGTTASAPAGFMSLPGELWTAISESMNDVAPDGYNYGFSDVPEPAAGDSETIAVV